MKILEQSDWSFEKAAHLMSRTHMASSRDDHLALYELGRNQGIEAAVNSIVDAPDDWDDFPFPNWWDSQDVPGPGGGILNSQDQFVQWYCQQLVHANPLGAKMFKFLVDHAPVSGRLLLEQHRWIYLFQHFDLCRSHALGNFRNFIHLLGLDGAMMWMLDLRASSRLNLNENYGRELLELFTLGVDGGYTEDDVVACTRAFTGRVTPVIQPNDWPYTPFLNQETRSPVGIPDFYQFIDTKEKTFLGQTLTGFLPEDDNETRVDHTEEVLDIIFQQPSCGEYLVWKLWRYFVSPNPPDELIQELGERFRVTHQYELRLLLKDFFMSEAFYASENIGNQIKDAGDYFVSCVNALDVDLPSPELIFLIMENLGYNVIEPPNIAGWPEPEREGNGWLGAERLLFRANMPLLWLEESFVMFDRLGITGSRTLVGDAPPSDFDVNTVIPAQFRERKNINLLLDELNDRLLPFHKLTDDQRKFLIENDERNYHELSDEGRLRQLIRVFMTLPAFQLQ